MECFFKRKFSRKLRYLAALALIAIVAGCVDTQTDSNEQVSTTVTSTTLSAVSDRSKILVAYSPEFGQYLVDGEDMAVYRYNEDESEKSNCYGQCAINWPPMLAEDYMIVAEGISGSIDVIDRADYTQQVAYNGIPLYYFSGDKKPGDTKGNGIKGQWSLVAPESYSLATTSTLVIQEATTSTTGAIDTTTTTAQMPVGMLLVKTTTVPPSSSYDFTYNGDKAILINFNGQYRAYVNSCPEDGCRTSYWGDSLRCPCDHSVFNPLTGEPESGPAKKPLQEISIFIDSETIFVKP